MGKRLHQIFRFIGQATGYLLIFPVRVYQKMLSPLLPKSCIYYPSCSHYMVHAIEKHGPFKGPALGVLRIGRCNPMFSGGVDEVRSDLTLAVALRQYREFYRKKEH